MKFSVAAALLTSTAGASTANNPRTTEETSPLANSIAAAGGGGATADNRVVTDQFLSSSTTLQKASSKKPTAVINGQKFENFQSQYDSILQQIQQQQQQQQLKSSGLLRKQQQTDHTQDQQPQLQTQQGEGGGSRRLLKNKHRTSRQRKGSNKINTFHRRRNLSKNKKRRDLKQSSANLRLTNPSPTTSNDEHGNSISPILCDPRRSSTGSHDNSLLSSYQRKTVSIRNSDKNDGAGAGAAAAASGPDVGILSCGLGLYCRPDPSSETGGYCIPQDLTTTIDDSQEDVHVHDSNNPDQINVNVEADVGILEPLPSLKRPFDDVTASINDNSNHFHQHGYSRRMQGSDYIDFDELDEEYCNNANFTCSECVLNENDYIGRIQCEYPEPCQALEDLYCGSGNISQICFENTVTITFDSSLYNITFCYGYSTPLDKIDLHYCVTYLYNENDGTTCQIKVDDVECTSCEYIYRPGNDDGNLVVFDCENTVLGFSGNETEDETILEGFLDYDVAYYFLPCSGGCNACGLERGMKELEAIIEFPNGEFESCEAFQLAYLTGELGPGSDGCAEFVPDQNVVDTCQCYGFGVPVITSPTSSPSLSPDEGSDSGDRNVIDYLNGVCTTFNSIFECDSCDVDPETFTADVSCTSIQSCRDVSSQCDSPVNMCSRRDIVANVTSVDEYEKTVCYETTTKDFDYQFTYCITYEKTSSPSCTMSVEGIECTSCDISSSNGGNDDNGNCYIFDCTNTMVGYAGNTCTGDLTSKLETYFLYKLLPCDDGCSLCADDETMTDGSQTFTYNDEEYNCLEAQLSALVGPTDDAFCTGAASAASEVCGCKDTTSVPPSLPPSAASSRSMPFPAMKGLVSVITLGTSVVAAVNAIFTAATT